MNNIYGQSEYKEVQEMLHQKLEALRIQYQDNDSLNKQFIDHDLDRMRKLGYID